MRKQDFYLCENKGADQLCSNCTADQHLCFCYTDSTIPPLLIPKFLDSSFLLWMYKPVWLEIPGPVFSRHGSFDSLVFGKKLKY